MHQTDSDQPAVVSIEVPVFRGAHLAACVRSVLHQTSTRWRLSLAWDGGDTRSRRLLERLSRWKHPQIDVAFKANEGIARTLRFLTERSSGQWILPLDDDDVLAPNAVECLIAAAEQKPWAAVWRGRRQYIDERGRLLENPNDIFPFGPRNYECGMVTDVWNFTQPYLIRRSAYARTSGWAGYADFFGAGDDGLSLELEEVGPIELVDEVLYYYRMHDNRTSLKIDRDGAYELWRRLSDAAIRRTGLAVRRVNEIPPYRFERVAGPRMTLEDVVFVVAAEPAAAEPATKWRDALLRYGVRSDAVLLAEGPVSAAWAQGIERTCRSIVALAHARTDPPSRDALVRLVEALNDKDVDSVAPIIVTGAGAELVAGAAFENGYARPVGRTLTGGGLRSAEWLGPAIVLAKRGALRAVGGVEASLRPELAAIDLCLKLRKRGLTCFEAAADQVIYRGELDYVNGVSEYLKRWPDL